MKKTFSVVMILALLVVGILYLSSSKEQGVRFDWVTDSEKIASISQEVSKVFEADNPSDMVSISNGNTHYIVFYESEISPYDITTRLNGTTFEIFINTDTDNDTDNEEIQTLVYELTNGKPEVFDTISVFKDGEDYPFQSRIVK